MRTSYIVVTHDKLKSHLNSLPN